MYPVLYPVYGVIDNDGSLDIYVNNWTDLDDDDVSNNIPSKLYLNGGSGSSLFLF